MVSTGFVISLNHFSEVCESLPGNGANMLKESAVYVSFMPHLPA